MAATPPRTAISAPPNGGNGVIRDPTRRRHAEARLLMPQNPHRYQHGGRRKTGEPGRATQLGARLRCPRTAAGPGRTTSRRTKPTSTTPSPTGEEGAARPESQGELRDSGPGCGARGRRRGLAEQRADTPSQPAPHQAPPVRRAPEDPEGTDGLRGAALQGNTAQARGRSGRDPDHQRDIKQHPHARDPSARARTSLGHNKAAHGHTHHSGTTKPPSPIGAGRQWR